MGFDKGSDISSDENLLDKIGNRLPEVIDESKIYRCEHTNCDKVFSRPSKLRRHICVHTKEKLYVCKYKNCDKGYSYAWHLKRHVSSVHENNIFKQTFICSERGCLKELSSEFALRRHIKHIHSKNDPLIQKYACNQCEQKFHKKNQLAAHSFTHTLATGLKCNKCFVSFSHLNDLKKHLSNHKTYTCHCGESFHKWTIFLNHKRTQHVNKYLCAFCPKMFSTKLNLKTHEQIHYDTRVTYECRYSECPRFYYYLKNLKHHIKSFHGSKRYVCTFDGCERSFVTNQKLKEHLKTHDPNWVRKSAAKKKRKTRKDAGVPKKDMALHLAGVKDVAELNSNENEPILNENDDINNDKQLELKSVSCVLMVVDRSVR